MPEIPTLDEAFDACAGMLVNVEIKNSPHDADFDPADRCAEAVVELVRARDLYDSVLVRRSTSRRSTGSTRSIPTIPTGYLVVVDPLPLAALEIAHEHGHRALHPYLAALGEAFARGRGGPRRGARDRAQRLDGRTTRRRSCASPTLGVDAIITDTPRDRAGTRSDARDARVTGTTSVSTSGSYPKSSRLTSPR